MMAKPASFPQFANLPAEIRLGIWEQAVSSPSMHVFDVCFPSLHGNDRSRHAFQRTDDVHAARRRQKWTKYEYVAFLDRLRGDDESARDIEDGNEQSGSDPSMYRHRQALRLACSEAASSAVLQASNFNTVYLPGHGSVFEYDNDNDVLFLRFTDRVVESNVPKSLSGLSRSYSRLSEALGAHWSAEMALTVWRARRIAIDVEETMHSLSRVEISYLAAYMQKDLEVLYLVDHHHSKRKIGERQSDGASNVRNRGRLFRVLHRMNLKHNLIRNPDVIYGVGRTYRETFDFEGVSWDELHPAYNFARLIAESIRVRQAAAGTEVFRGVRVLLAGDDTA
ncbi:hypothetical protein CPLU01_08744 [Colletotrichum plurivorum]|uniref:2EXR domain-containing protein n=1 Tax=Colletotrichum plurivorum TaxID=2175906 RepID=A0A8H6KBL7_9PEZI|nr:hypothetical protein CPLU01_08744 [Colletotrichum plurivorum]